MAAKNGSSSTTPTEQVMALYEQWESQAGLAGERLVGSRGFAGLLGQLAENAAALTKLGADTMDLMLRNLRLAGRRDVVRLARQLARTEDKLERVLQEVEELREELAGREATGDSAGRGATDNGVPARGRAGGRSARSRPAGSSGGRSRAAGSSGARGA